MDDMDALITDSFLVQQPQDVIPAHDITENDMEVTDLTDPDQLVGDKDIILACIDMLTRCGADRFTSHIDQTMLPCAWISAAHFPEGRWVITAGISAEEGFVRLLQEIIDGGLCTHCEKPVALVRAFDEDLDAEQICWYQMDPELKRFRRSCEGEDPSV